MPLAAGTRLGPYEVVAPLGAGGMGEVYRARDTRLGREVAVKVLPTSVSSDPERQRRFEQEARAASLLSHPNIIALYDLGVHEGAPYVVSELLEGETLRARLEGRALPARRAAEYATQIARGLAAAHEKGLVHRDLKPENLFVTKDGHVKILDFGLAKLTRPEELGRSPDGETMTRQTDPGTVLGTVGYMSPEQVRGRAVDHRSDIFSFGTILYEMVAGRRPFSGDTAAETMTAILKEEPTELADLSPGLPPAVLRIVRHCLEKRPEERFASARDLAFDLEAVSGETTTSGRAPAVVEHKRRPLLALAVLGLVGLYSALVFMAGRHVATKSPPSFRQITFRGGMVTSGRFVPDASTVVYSAAWEGAPGELFSARLDSPLSQALGLTAVGVVGVAAGEIAVQRVDPAKPGSGLTVARLPLSGGTPRAVFEGILSADWTTDDQRFLIHRWTGGREQIEFPVGKVLYQTAGSISNPRISPRPDRIAFIDAPLVGDNRGSLVVMDLAGQERTRSGPWNDITGLAWSPDGGEVWFSASQGAFAHDLRAVDLEGRERLMLPLVGRVWLHDVARDGRVLIAQGRVRGEAYGVAPDGTRERSLTWLDMTALAGLSADGARVAFTEWGEGGGPNYSIYVRGMDGSAPVRLGDAWARRLSPDGQWVVAAVGVTPTHLVLLPTGAGESRPLPSGSVVRHHGVYFFPDSRRILFWGNEADRPVRLFAQDIPDGTPKPVTAEGTETGGVISPDGRLVVAYPSHAGAIAALYPVEGGDSQPIPGISPNDGVVAWAGDGHELYVRESGTKMPLRVYRLDLRTGRRELWREIAPPDSSGVLAVRALFITPDGRGYAYDYLRTLSDLYVVSGLR